MKVIKSEEYKLQDICDIFNEKLGEWNADVTDFGIIVEENKFFYPIRFFLSLKKLKLEDIEEKQLQKIKIPVNILEKILKKEITVEIKPEMIEQIINFWKIIIMICLGFISFTIGLEKGFLTPLTYLPIVIAIIIAKLWKKEENKE